MNRTGRQHLSRTERFIGFWFSPADPRSYDLFRIAFGLVSLLNWVFLWPTRMPLLSGEGMVDAEAVKRLPEGDFYFSVFYWWDSPAAVNLVMGVGLIGLIGLTTGTFTRTSAALTYLWHLSYLRRLIIAPEGWDRILVIYSLLLLISPIGRVWSVDAWRRQRKGEVPRAANRERGRAAPVPSYGLKLMKLQLVVIYFNTAWLKLPDPYWQSGEFLAYWLMSTHSRVASPFWAEHVWISMILTWGALATEFVAPVLLFFRKTRPLAFVLGYALHGGIAAVSNIYPFGIVMMVLYLPFLDGRDLDGLKRAASAGIGRFRGKSPPRPA